MNKQKGLTLFEILIGISITAIGGVLLMGLLTSSGNLFLDQSIQVNHGLSSNQAKQEIADLIKSSSGVAVQYPATGTAEYTTGQNVLVVKMPSFSANGQVIDSVYDYGVVTGLPDNSRILKLKVFPNALSNRHSEDKVLSTSLESFNLTYTDANNNTVSPTQAVRITFIINLSDKDGMGDNKSSSSTTVNLKNL